MKTIHFSFWAIFVFSSLILCGCQSYDKDELTSLQNEYKAIQSELAEKEGQLNKLKDENNRLLSELEHLKTDLYFSENRAKFIWGDALFDASGIKVGDIVAGLKLKEIIGTKYIFEGQKIVKGKFTIWNDEYYKDMISFAIDDKNANELPRALSDSRTLWFMFANRDEAYSILKNKNSNEYIDLLIENYVIDLKESEVINSAILIKAIND